MLILSGIKDIGVPFGGGCLRQISISGTQQSPAVSLRCQMAKPPIMTIIGSKPPAPLAVYSKIKRPLSYPRHEEIDECFQRVSIYIKFKSAKCPNKQAPKIATHV